MAPSKVSLKLLVDTKGQRVLFAEASKDFVDFLFNILSLPVGTVIRLLSKQQMVGCIANLYESVENMSDTYIQQETNKDILLKPKVISNVANVPLLLPNIQSPTTINFYRCNGAISSNGYYLSNQKYSCKYFSNDPTSICPTCNNFMNIQVTLVNPPNKASSSSAGNDKGGYVKGVATYMIMDDLVVSPMSTISSITLLNKFQVKNVGALEERLIDVSMNEGVELLKASLQSNTVLTDVFFKLKPKRKRSK
ncbi:hypothetical protein COLO4_10926 [Corchorus olitorius]|uniref:DUF674 domain-containing protein n=1 Tax=Corchorus olitorius TaxID=93759 RepID=A0A1R3K6C1_9ROSI|nr:hypothetical protein COLO4_10926 [Corchorus olitorius]